MRIVEPDKISDHPI